MTLANTYPYVASSGPLVKAVTQLRKSFPKEVTADTLRKLSIAPNNESYVLNVLRFIGVIDSDGKKDIEKAKVFAHHDEEKFHEAFGKLVKDAYSEVFDLHLDEAWSLDKADLVQFFRTNDESTDIVGKRQASTFVALAALSGHGDLPVPKTNNSTNNKEARKKVTSKKAIDPASPKPKDPKLSGDSHHTSSVGLTVRVEVNLPADGDQKTYDMIFSSIRKNLIDGS